MTDIPPTSSISPSVPKMRVLRTHTSTVNATIVNDAVQHHPRKPTKNQLLRIYTKRSCTGYALKLEVDNLIIDDVVVRVVDAFAVIAILQRRRYVLNIRNSVNDDIHYIQ